jgi:hypothetical protein
VSGVEPACKEYKALLLPKNTGGGVAAKRYKMCLLHTMTLVLFPIVAIILGLLLWWLAPGQIAKDVGKILFAVGAFWLVGGNNGPGLTIR